MMATEQPNVLLVLADDVGWFDVGAYHRGIMGAARPISTGSRPRVRC
jgi:arylsulfatase A-like enzyme